MLFHTQFVTRWAQQPPACCFALNLLTFALTRSFGMISPLRRRPIKHQINDLIEKLF
jgi:hypothetical protein